MILSTQKRGLTSKFKKVPFLPIFGSKVNKNQVNFEGFWMAVRNLELLTDFSAEFSSVKLKNDDQFLASLFEKSHEKLRKLKIQKHFNLTEEQA